MTDSYSLTARNESGTGQMIAIFATLPVSGGRPLCPAWQAQFVVPEAEHVFTWHVDWGFACSNQRAVAGARWSPASRMDADPRSTFGSAARVTDVGGCSLRPETGPGTGDALVMNADPSVPVAGCSVGLTLGGEAVCVVDAMPNLRQRFTLTPTYYLDAGPYDQGQLMPEPAVTNLVRLPFTPSVTALTAILDADGTWDVRQGAQARS